MNGNLSREEVSKRLRAARVLAGKENQEVFARLLREQTGVTFTAYGEYERGNRDMQARDRIAIARALEVPEEWFTEPLERVFRTAPPLLEEMNGKLDELLKKDP